MNELPLRNDGLVLRVVEQDDMMKLYELIYSDDDPEWKKWDAPYYPLEPVHYDQYEHNTHARLKADQKAGRPESIRVIEVDGEILGMISYYIEDPLSMWLEMGIIIYKPARWGRGIGTRSLHMWSSHLFEHMPIVRVGLTTWSGNERMIGAAAKIGLQIEGRMRKCRVVHGKYYDSIRMGMLREEWEQKRSGETDGNVYN